MDRNEQTCQGELIETMARAITVAHGERPFGLYDYSKYPGPKASPPHVVRNERTGEGVFRSYNGDEAEKVFKELTERHVATAAIAAIEAAGYAVAPKQSNTAPLDLFGEPIRESVAAGPAANVEETIVRLDAAITRLDVLLDRLSDELRESRVY